MNYEEIGKLYEKVYLAEIERIKARNARQQARDSHKCEGVENGGAPCWLETYRSFEKVNMDDWCDNCKYVQSYHVAFKKAVQNSRIARYCLTRRIKKGLKELINN